MRELLLCAGVALVLLGRPALADGPMQTLTPGDLSIDAQMAWTRDGTYFIYRSSSLVWSPSHTLTMRRSHVRNARLGVQQSFEIGIYDLANSRLKIDDSTPELRQRLEEMRRDEPLSGGPPEFARWQQGHPSNPCHFQRISPDGRVSAQVTIVGTRGTPLRVRWVGQALQFADVRWQRAPEDPTMSAFERDGYTSSYAVVTLEWSQKGRPRRPYRIELEDPSGPLKGELGLCWSPDSRRVAVVLHRLGHSMRSVDIDESTQARLFPVAGPRVHLRAPRSRLAAAAAELAGVLERSGLFPVVEAVDYGDSDSPGPKPPATTRLFAHRSAEAAAQSLAAVFHSQSPPGALPDGSPYDLALEVSEQ